MSFQLPDHTRRLAKLVNKPGGITVNEAVTAAEQNLQTIRDRGLQQIAAVLDQMQLVADSLQVCFTISSRAELYELSNSLIGVAGVFGLREVGEVAYSLCTLLDRIEAWHMALDHMGRQGAGRAAVRLHLDSLRLLRSGGIDADQMHAVGTALRQVVERVFAAAAP